MFGELQVGITLYSWEHTLCKTNKQIPTEFKSILYLRVYVSIQLLDLTPSTGSICHNRNKCSFTLMNQVMNILFFFTQKQNRSGGKKDKNIIIKKKLAIHPIVIRLPPLETHSPQTLTEIQFFLTLFFSLELS